MSKALVTPISMTKIDRLQDSWSVDDYKAIIELLGGEYADLDSSEIEEYMEMMIVDNELPESAYNVLQYALGEELNEGQLRNLSNEMEDDKMWEEYPDMDYHQEIFKVNQLLYSAYNGKVPKGHAMVIEMKVETSDHDLLDLLMQRDADLTLRLVMGGMDSHAKIHRLFDNKSEGKYIVDAKHILWQIKIVRESEKEVVLMITSSTYWLESYQDEENYNVNIDMDIYKREIHK